ncbi:DUF590-domain-containing protein [Dacryopinax primogenitus]|uniref:DUF590-domain-containing protein n=1 Tax=Dacryopinax primogenitus (strain DJM 731) TaxID=1858805 RepID=M5GBK8_DACPD|nr:DUF590-domain-containing protein [Dacryopinax primogenitus]EJU03447.1 DUF590-domain-containing protein [Dacryopinax primogenitus]
MTTPSPVDLILIFRTSPKSRTESEDAERAYTSLLSQLTAGGLEAVGKSGATPSELLIFVRCSWDKMKELVDRQRTEDFLHSVSAASMPALERPVGEATLTPADRLRLLHSYITTSIPDGGLGIAPGASGHERVKGIMALKNKQFEHEWIRSWTLSRLGVWMSDAELGRVKDEYGESVALYYAFLSSYAHALLIPSWLGGGAWYFNLPYSPWYAIPLCLWSIFFVELFRLRERTLAVQWGTRNSQRVERRRAEFNGTINEDGVESFPWWQREIRKLASIPVILTESFVLGLVLTAIFVFEAFVTQIYTGPGHAYAGYIPTVIFLTFIPKLLEMYQASGKALTNWENHAHQSSYATSLTLKTFTLSAVVAYLGLYLTAFVYIPFGPNVMGWVYTKVLALRMSTDIPPTTANTMSTDAKVVNGTRFDSLSNAQAKIRPDRLHNQMFAYTVTNQAVNFVMEIVLPYVTRAASNLQQGKGLLGNKGLVTPEEQSISVQERDLLLQAREEAALPDYELFGDYAEMVTQFGYVVLWSVAWPLAPFCALVNNWVEIRSDAFKLTAHYRRPLPSRTESIGPWLDSLSFLCWLGALTTAALIFLFKPTEENIPPVHGSGLGSQFLTTKLARAHLPSETETLITAVLPALLVALAASHAFLLAQSAIRFVLEKLLWQGSPAQVGLRKREREVRLLWAQKSVATAGGSNPDEVGRDLGAAVPDPTENREDEWKGFWEREEGLSEIRSNIKTA